MISRRKLFGLLAAGAVVAPELLSARTIFLPPRGGWPHGRLAALIIPPEHAYMWADEIAAGCVEYDAATQTMSLLKRIDTPKIKKWAESPPIVLTEYGDDSIFARVGTTPLRFEPGIQEREMEMFRNRPMLVEPVTHQEPTPVENLKARIKARLRATEIRERMAARQKTHREWLAEYVAPLDVMRL